MEKPKTSHTTPPSIRLIAPHRTSPEDPMCYFSPFSPLNFSPVQTYSRYLNNVNEPTMKPDRTWSPSCLEARLSELRHDAVLRSSPPEVAAWQMRLARRMPNIHSVRQVTR